MSTFEYKPAPTISAFVQDYIPGQLFYDWIVGPFGSSKTTGIFFKLCYMASLQAKGPDGIRRTRAVIVRNTAPQLNDTTINSWFTWFKPGQAGVWEATKKDFTLKFGDVECEVMFRPLDTAKDIARVLSLEVTFAIIDEFVEIPRAIVDALSARCGRYPSEVDGGCTNWGMWGASNPSTEDNWWHEYLHDGKNVIQPGESNAIEEAAMALIAKTPRRIRYFLQPPGLLEDGTGNPDAENVQNLPGKTDYYVNQAVGKSEAWINQFLKARWGFSISGKPVVQTFRSELHLSSKPLVYDPALPLIGGYDPGLAGSAMIFGQEDPDGRLLVIGELVQQGYGTERFISERLKPFLRRYFPLLDPLDFIAAIDPAGANRSGADEKVTSVEIMKRHYAVSSETNNRLPLRLDAIDYFMTRLINGKPAIQIDAAKCPVLVRALKGGWRYKLDTSEEVKGNEPEKNSYSHPGDGFGYLCRYYHRQASRNERYARQAPRAPVMRQRFGPRAYHAR
jgi:hypothetical protein